MRPAFEHRIRTYPAAGHLTESVAELKVATLLYGGDSGGTAGAQVDLVSKSGSNTFHGSFFFFFRNNAAAATATP
jgi:hypothetical protein